MFFLEAVDAMELNLVGGLTGLLGLQGTQFCEQPTLIYISGCFIVGSNINERPIFYKLFIHF
jgi:uncharacterized membrane protein